MSQVTKASESQPADTSKSASVSGSGTLFRPHWVALATGVVGFIILYLWWPYQHWQFTSRGSVLLGWWKVLMLDASAEWQFCLVVPIIAGFLAYRQKETLKNLSVKGSWLGLPVLIMAGLVYWLGFKVDTGYLGYASLQLGLAGFILLLGGVQWMRALFVPWVLMAFAWPLFPLDNLLAAKLKIPTAQIATLLLKLSGIGVVREGAALQSAADFAAGIKQGEKFILEVADSCSGMRSLYALIMVAVLYSFMALRRTVPRLILSFSAIPLAVAGNVVRLILLTIGSLLFGQEWAVGRRVGDHQEESFFHILAGFMVFGVALAGMFTIATWLEGKHWKKLDLLKGSKKQSDSVKRDGDRMPAVLWKAGAAMGVVGLALLLCAATPDKLALEESGFRPVLPEVVDSYRGTPMEMSYKERMNFDPEVVLKRMVYESPGNRPVIATLVVSGPVKRTLHPPEVCLPNQGWLIAGTDEVQVPLKDGKVIHAAIMRIFRDHEIAPGKRVRFKAMNLFWYHGSNGYSTPGYHLSHFINYRDALLFNFNHRWSQAAFFMPVSEAPIGGENPFEDIVAAQQLIDFAKDAASSFVKTE